MKFEIIIPAIVREEITEAIVYYNQKQQGLGDKIILGPIGGFGIYREHASFLSKVLRQIQAGALKKFPSLFVFRIFDDQVLINKFIHAKKLPVKRYK